MGTIAAFPALVVIGRRRLGRIARAGLATLMAGIVLGIPVMLMKLGFYVQNAQLHDLLMPYVLTPLGMLAGPVAWLGLAVFGIAAVRDGALPAATGALFAARRQPASNPSTSYRSNWQAAPSGDGCVLGATAAHQ